MGCSLDFHYTYSNASHNLIYDLCPLFSQHQSLRHEVAEETPPTHTTYAYEIALGNGIKKDGTLPAALQCPSGSLICMTVINQRPDHPSEPARILQVVPAASEGARPKFRITNTTTGVDIKEPHLQLTVQGSRYMTQKQKTVFHVFCDKDVEETSTPKLEHLYRWNGSHVFSWKSIYGCPKITILDEPSEAPDDAGSPDEALPPADTEPEEEQLVPTPPRSPLWYSTALLLFLLLLFVLLSVCQPTSADFRISTSFITAFQAFLPTRYKHYIRHLKIKLSNRLSYRSGEYDFLLEDIGAEGSTTHDPDAPIDAPSRYRKYTF